MKEFSKYKTFDNKEFKDKDKAIKHEETLKLFNIVQIEIKSDILKESIFDNYYERYMSVHKDINEEQLEALKLSNIVQIEVKSDKESIFHNYYEIYMLVHKDINEDQLETLTTLIFGPHHNIVTGEENWALKSSCITDDDNFDYEKLRCLIALDDKHDYAVLADELHVCFIERGELYESMKVNAANSCKLAFQVLQKYMEN